MCHVRGGRETGVAVCRPAPAAAPNASRAQSGRKRANMRTQRARSIPSNAVQFSARKRQNRRPTAAERRRLTRRSSVAPGRGGAASAGGGNASNGSRLEKANDIGPRADGGGAKLVVEHCPKLDRRSWACAKLWRETSAPANVMSMALFNWPAAR